MKAMISKILSALITIHYSLVALYLNVVVKNEKRFYQMVRQWAKKTLKVNSIELIISGNNKLVNNETCVYVTNHSSMYDIPVVYAAISSDLRIIYKEELEKVPIFGYSLKKTPFIAINRSNPRESMVSMQKAIESIKEDVSVVIFPEGTRNPARDEMGDFKRGGFMLASRSGKKIVPAAITGSSDVLKWKPAGEKKYKIWIDFLDPVEIKEGAFKADENAIMKQVRDDILQQVKKRVKEMK
jgi:1-acyl-sn-glycerol-3-phosphate acyltransferase